MPFNPEKITRADVLKAVEIIEKDGYGLRTSTGYDVIINDKAYPPKEIMRYAHEVATGELLWQLSGGEPTNKYLRKLGFEIIDKGEDNENLRQPVFTWIPAYDQITQRLLQYENRQPELIELLESIGITNFNDQDIDGKTFPLSEIDPLTFLCYLNKYGDEKRLLFLRSLCEKWSINQLPEDVHGIPNVNAQRVWLFPYKKARNNNEIQRLWNYYKSIMNNTIDNALFEDVLQIRGVGKPKLTEGMFMVKPNDYLCLNGVVKPYLQSHSLSTDFGSYDEYVRKIQLAKQKLNKSFPEISYEAYLKAVGREEEADKPSMASDNEENYVTSKKTVMSSPLNNILYGPPGTGKTYHTINKSVAIANPQFNITKASREQLKVEYDRLVKDGQIEFITFHQSMSYEDFIEGIKPVEPKENDEFLKYEIKEGIFKRLCERASKVPETKPGGFSISEDEFQKAGFYKMSLGDTSNPDDDQIYEWCIKNGYIALGRGDANDFTGMNESDIQHMVPGRLEKFTAQSVNIFIHYIKPGDYVVVTYGNLLFRAIGKVTGSYEFKNIEGLSVHQFRKVDWLIKDIELPYEELYEKQFQQQSVYRLDKKAIKKDFFVKSGSEIKQFDNKPKNYVLIIDEINRGNVSQIFGELITLIEEDKRTGKEEALTAILPYSKKSFSVPPNLYIIGTMNTADRSVEALDTALRRRFVFEEMKPKAELLSPQRIIWDTWWKYEVEYWDEEPYTTLEKKLYPFLGIPAKFGHDDVLWNKLKESKHESQIELFNDMPIDNTGINLQKLLIAINNRLEALLTKDHTIGHAWLMNVFSLEDLQAAFKNKILPLLQEFFYNDYAKIGLVLGKNFVKTEQIGQKLFADFDDGNELASEYADKMIYTLKDPFDLQLEDFRSIYQ